MFILHKIAVNSIWETYHFHRKNESILYMPTRREETIIKATSYIHTRKCIDFVTQLSAILKKGRHFVFLCGQDNFWKKSFIESVCSKSLACIIIWSISMIYMQLAAGLVLARILYLWQSEAPKKVLWITLIKI